MMKIADLTGRLGLKALAAAGLLALSSTHAMQAADKPAPPWEQLPTPPAAMQPVADEQQPAPLPLTPPATPPAATPKDPALEKLIVDTIKKYEADKKKADDEKKKAEDEKKAAEGTIVGADNKLNVTFDNGGFRYTSNDGSFRMHFGGRLMSDFNFFSQSPNLQRGPATPAALVPTTGIGPGIGDLQDGFFIRRARIIADGTFNEVFEFRTEMDLENYNSLTFDEMYVGLKSIPVLDAIRIGHMHVPFGLEAYTSSRWLPQMERSPLFDAFYQEFAEGVFINKTFLDQRITTQHMFHRIDNFAQFNGDAFGDGRYAYSGRVSALPIYEDEGRHLLHLGIAYQWRNGGTPADFNGGTAIGNAPAGNNFTTELFRFRTRQSIRAAVGAEGDGNRIVDTGNIFADHVNSVNGELLGYWGPVWIQSEAVWANVANAFYPVVAAAAPAATARGNLNFWGAYVQTGIFLTGEKRGYDKRFGKADRVIPNENFFLVKGEDGKLAAGMGAWEATYRFAIVDLNSGAGATAVLGGIYREHTVGVNWYMTPNYKIQFNYLIGNREVPALPAGAAGGTNANGWVQGIGIRSALEF